MNPKRAGKQLESEIEKDLMDLVDQKREDDIRIRTHRIWSSGNAMSDKGDVITNIEALPKQLLIECKRRKTKSKKQGSFFNVEYIWLDKIKEEAEKRGCIPSFVFSFVGKRDKRLWCIYPKENQLGLRYLEIEGVLISKETKKYIRVYNNKMEHFIYSLNGWYLIEWNVFLAKLQEVIDENIINKDLSK